MKVSRDHVLIKLLNIDPHWLDHVRDMWDSQKEEPSCGCEVDDGDGFTTWPCTSYREFLIECFKYLHNGLTPAQDLALRQNMELVRRNAEAEISNKARAEEWEDLKRRGLTP
jgi:hypothetical protein